MCKRDEDEVKHAGCYSNNRAHAGEAGSEPGRGDTRDAAEISLCVAEKLKLLNEREADPEAAAWAPFHRNRQEPSATSLPGWDLAPSRAQAGAHQTLRQFHFVYREKAGCFSLKNKAVLIHALAPANCAASTEMSDFRSLRLIRTCPPVLLYSGGHRLVLLFMAQGC